MSGNTCTYAAGSLPIELQRFSVEISNPGAKLTWLTASELDNEKFFIERSGDGREYKIIGEMAGKGTTNEAQYYSFVDEKPLQGVNYYRLKQVDFDGNFEYSPVQTLLFRKDGEIVVYPTIVEQVLNLDVPETMEEATSLKVYTIQGALVYQASMEGTGKLTFDLPALSAGQYVAEVLNGQTASRTIIMKQ